MLSALRDRFAATRRPWTLVVDGVDESRHPAGMVTDVLIPLSRSTDDEQRPLVRLLLGLRSALPGTSGNTGRRTDETLDLLRANVDDMAVVRTDGEEALADLRQYIAVLLTAQGPYRTAPDARWEIAGVVAEQVWPSFLDARYAAQHLRDASHQQRVDAPDWLTSLRQGTIGLLRRDIREVAAHMGVAPGHLLAVLRASAFALGAGVPKAMIWPALTEAVLGQRLSDAQTLIDQVLASRLGGYLITDTEDGRLVRRPAHESLTERLRHSPHLFLDPE
jgi:hypothetical protein